MERGSRSRIGPICGLLLVALFVGLSIVVGSGEMSYVAPRESAEEVARYVEAQRDVMRLLAVVAGLAAVLVVAFVADVHERLRAAVPRAGRWLTTTFLIGGALVAVGFVLQLVLSLGASAIGDFGDDVQVARAVHALSTDALAGVVPGVALMTGAAAGLSLGHRVLPRWLGVIAIVVLVVNLLAYWLMAWMLWVLATAVVALVAPDEIGPRATSAARATPTRA